MDDVIYISKALVNKVTDNDAKKEFLNTLSIIDSLLQLLKNKIDNKFDLL